MRTVLVFGTFDSIHPGHRWFLQQAASLGNEIIAVVARDKFVAEWKGKAPHYDEQSRMASLMNSGMVNEVRLADECIHTYSVLQEITPDVICLGHDQKALKADLESFLVNNYTENSQPKIHSLPPWRRQLYSSTRITKVKSSWKTWILYSLLVSAVLSIGFSWASGIRLAPSADMADLVFIRFFCTSVLCLPLLISRQTLKISIKEHLPTIFMALCLVCYNLLFFFGLESGLAGRRGVIVSTIPPLLTLLIVSFLSKNTLRGIAIPGSLIGVAAGLILLKSWQYTSSGLVDPGNLVFLMTALFWAIMMAASHKVQIILGSFARIIAILYTAGFLILTPFIIMKSGLSVFTGHDTIFWLDMVFLSAASGFYGIGLYYFASRELETDRTCAFAIVVPVSAAGFAWIIPGEGPDPAFILGGALAIIAFVLINIRRKTN